MKQAGMMIEQSDIVEIYSQEDFSSVTIKMSRAEAEVMLSNDGFSRRGGGRFYCNSNGYIVALVMDRKTEFFSR